MCLFYQINSYSSTSPKPKLDSSLVPPTDFSPVATIKSENNVADKYRDGSETKAVLDDRKLTSAGSRQSQPAHAILYELNSKQKSYLNKKWVFVF